MFETKQVARSMGTARSRWPLFRSEKIWKSLTQIGRTTFGTYRYPLFFLFSLILLEWIIAAILGTKFLNISAKQLLMIGDIRQALPGWLFIPLVWLGLATFKLVRDRVERPTITLLRLLRLRSSWMIRGLLLLACYFPMARSFSVIKSSIPSINEYYLDPLLVKVDVWMLGTDAWRLTYAIFPDWFLFAIDRVYILWFTYVLLLAGWFCFSRDERFQVRGTITLNLCWILIGGVAAVSMASVGPCFYGLYYPDDHFRELMILIDQAHDERGLVARHAMDYLIANAGTGKFGAGISAMPSMHVSMAFLGFLATLTSSRSKSLKVFTGLFFAATLIGSVHLGWHYLSDSLVSVVGTTLIWYASGWLVDHLHRLDIRNGVVVRATVADKAAPRLI
jgi:hypothetical protein